MASDLRRDVEAWLADLLDHVIDWLQLAERKNVGLAGLISTFLVLIVTFLTAGPSVPLLAGGGLAVGALTLMISLLLAMASLLPATNLERARIEEHALPGVEDNLIYFGHLARYEPRALVRAAASHFAEAIPDEVVVSKLALDLAEQIVTNARITERKLRLYRSAMLLFAAGVLIAAVAMDLAAFVG